MAVVARSARHNKPRRWTWACAVVRLAETNVAGSHRSSMTRVSSDNSFNRAFIRRPDANATVGTVKSTGDPFRQNSWVATKAPATGSWPMATTAAATAPALTPATASISHALLHKGPE